MDEKFKIQSSSCETPLHVLDSTESISGTCEQIEYLATSSTSVIENIPVTNLETMPNIKAKEIVKREIGILSTSDKSLDDSIKSISETVKLLEAEQSECNQRINMINTEFKRLPAYLNSASSTEEIVNLKSATIKLIDAEKKTNSHLSLIKDSLISITSKCNLDPSSIRELKQELNSLTKLIIEIDPKQEKHKNMLTKIKNSLENERPFSANSQVVSEIRNPMSSFIELSIAEISAKITVLLHIKKALNSIKKEFPQLKEIKVSESEKSRDGD